MYFDSMQAMLHMDGHGAYVWAAYGVTLMAICSILMVPLRRRTRLISQLRGELRRSAGAPSPKEESNASSS